MRKTFTINLKDAAWNRAEFSVEGLEVNDKAIEFDDITLYLDGNEYDGHISTWAGRNLSAGDIFESCINSYLRNAKFHFEFEKEWGVFDIIKNTARYENGVCVYLPCVEFGDVEYRTLDLATDNYLFYINDGDFFLFYKDGDLITDYECFYMSALYDELKLIENGETNCLYMSDTLKEWLESEDGKEWLDA